MIMDLIIVNRKADKSKLGITLSPLYSVLGHGGWKQVSDKLMFTSVTGLLFTNLVNQSYPVDRVNVCTYLKAVVTRYKVIQIT